MTELSNAVGRELVESITSLVKPKSNGETRRGDVTRVDPGGRTWVRIEGNEFDTCCTRSSVACKPGDSVSVALRNNRATIEGNYTSPATDDSKAIEAIKTGSSAQQTANMAHELATNAIADAQVTRDAAERAEADATRAANAAESASISAASAATSAENAERDAERSAVAAELSERKALESNGYALGALNSLATLQDVMGTIGWAADNAAFVEASGEYDPNGRYFVKGGYWLPKTLTQEQYEDGTWYVKGEDGTYSEATGDYDADAAYYTWVAGTFTDTQDPPNLYAVVPESSKADFDAGSYYVMDMRQSMAEYVSKHVVFAYGTLWITPDGVTGEGIAGEGDDPAGRIAIGTEGITLYDGHGRRIARYGNGVDLGAAGDGTQTSIASDVLALLREAVIDGEPGTYPVFQVGTEAGENPFFQFADGKGHDLFTVDSTGKPTFAKPVPIPSGGTDATTAAGARGNLSVPSVAKGGSYWGLGFPDGTNVGYMRTPSSGLIPRMEGGVENTYLGTSGWPFYQCHAKEFYGTWKGNALDIAHGGTNSNTAASARSHLYVPGMTYDSGSKHWLITQPDGGNGNWWRIGTAGIIPPSADSTNKTGKANIGSNGWYFASAYVVNYYGNWAGNTIPVGKGGTGAADAATARSNLGAAASSHNHAAGNITSGTLAVARGGTGITSNPSMLVNLSSTSAASVFAASPRPGITGVLGYLHGGTDSSQYHAILSLTTVASNRVTGIQWGGWDSNRNMNYIEVKFGDGSAYGVNCWASDERIKSSIEDSETCALDVVRRIRHRSFEMDGVEYQVGYVAQELDGVEPSFVIKVPQSRDIDEESYFTGDYRYQVDERGLIPYLSKAIQELADKVETLEARVAELEGGI